MMTEFQEVKPGDLITVKSPQGKTYFEAVIIGLPTETSESYRPLGVDSSTILPGTRCYRKLPGYESGHFLTFNNNQWREGKIAHYTPRSQNEKASRNLLQNAKLDLTNQNITYGNLGLDSRDAKEVLDTIESLL